MNNHPARARCAPIEQEQPKTPLPALVAPRGMPDTVGTTQSGLPSSLTRQSWSLPQWTSSQGSAAHRPEAFRHTMPDGHAMPEHRLGLQLPVVVSQKKSLAQRLEHADFKHVPWEHTWDAPHDTPAQLCTQAPA